MTSTLLQQAVEALNAARDRIACSVCHHDETQRRGFIWTECLQCGAMFADDKGGVTAPKEPKELAQIDAAIASLSALQQQEGKGEAQCIDCGDSITAHNPGVCGTCFATKYRDGQEAGGRTRKCLYCERDMIVGSECTSATQASSCDGSLAAAPTQQPPSVSDGGKATHCSGCGLPGPDPCGLLGCPASTSGMRVDAPADPFTVSAALHRLIADDAYAMTFQTFGQYRTALLNAIEAATAAAGVMEVPRG